MMTRKERLRRCYYYQELDRPAVYSRTGFPENDRSYNKLKQFLQQHTELKVSFDGTKFESLYPIEKTFEPYSDDFKREITTIKTPKGNLVSTAFVSLKNQPGLHETYLLKNREDAEKYLSLPKPSLSGNASKFFLEEQKIQDAGLIDVCIGLNPAGFVAELFGTENFALTSIMDRDIVHALLQRQMEIILERVKFILSIGIGPFFSIVGEEYITPPLHSPKDFYEFNVKYDKPIIDLIHNAGGRVHAHCHGSIRDVFDCFIEMGADVLHPFEAPPSGNITAKQAKEKSRGKICLEGNLQISSMYEWTPDQVAVYTKKLIDDAFDDKCGLIVSPSASPYIPGAGEICFPQYEAMIKTVLDYNRAC